MADTDIFVNDFIIRSFRDVADHDYIAARILWRYDLTLQFLWSGLQALEKYLKAILLYNGQSTKEFSHNIYEAFQRVRAIADIPFDFPSDIELFIKFLEKQGPNRYFEHSIETRGTELLSLDRTVWYVRKYCQDFRLTRRDSTGKEVDLFQDLAQEAADSKPDQAHRFGIGGGRLEEVLKSRGRLRDHL